MPVAETCDWTEEPLFDGAMVIRQPRSGFRFALDAVLLAGLTRCGNTERALDLGTGCAVVPLVMCHRGRAQEWVGIDIQAELVALARWNVTANGFHEKIRIELADLRSVPDRWPGGGYDLVVSNPPYRRLDVGRICANPQRAAARHELTANLENVFEAARHLLKRNGRLALVYPAPRLSHLLHTAASFDFGVQRITPIYTKPSRAARLVHAECCRAGGGVLSLEAPFFVQTETGEYSPAMQRLYAG